jgi:trk system potassium uptake protein TrkH
MMRWRLIGHIVGVLVVCIGLCMLLALGFSLYYRDAGTRPLLISIAITLAAGAVCAFAGQRPSHKAPLTHREGMAATTLCWVAAALFGGLPFYFGGILPGPENFVFESISGFTTTGASVIRDVEIVPRGILFWRSLTHWLGGMGIIVLGLAILPFLGVGGMQLYKAEVPGPVPDKLKPRLKDTAMILWQVYVSFSLVQTLLLMAGGMELFDALCHTFGTMATGGFSTKNASIGHYNSLYIDVVVTVFMLIGGVNFALHFQLFRGNPRAMWQDGEWRFFMVTFLVFTSLIVVDLLGTHTESIGQAARHSAFTVASIITTTGYATTDFELWPPLAQCILLMAMIIGGSVGSTGGAAKCMRIMVMLKQSYSELLRLIHPRAVVQVKIGRQVVAPAVMSGVWGFMTLYLLLLVVSMLAVAGTGVDLVTSATSVMACIGNVGPGLGAVGPMDNYLGLPCLAKWVLSLDMLLGRLEIYTVLVLFLPRLYRK